MLGTLFIAIAIAHCYLAITYKPRLAQRKEKRMRSR